MTRYVPVKYGKTWSYARRNSLLSRHNPPDAKSWTGASAGMTRWEIQKIFDQVMQGMINTEVFTHSFMCTLKFNIGFEVDTAAVAWNKTLRTHEFYFNQDLLVWLSKTGRLGVATHEICHIIMEHTTNYPDNVQWRWWNIAGDLLINDSIVGHQMPKIITNDYGAIEFEGPSGKSLPDWVILFATTMPDLYPPGTDYRRLRSKDVYEKLLERKKQLEEEEKENGDQQGKKPGEGSPGEKGQPGGKGKGKPKNTQPPEKSSSPKADEFIRREIQREKEGKKYEGSEHHDPEEELTEEEKRERSEDIRRRIRESSKNVSPSAYGNLPGWMQDSISAAFSPLPPLVSWKTLLRRFMSNASRTKIKATMNKPSRRMVDADGNEMYPGIKLKRILDIVVMVDTSGSVGTETVKQIFSQFDHILKATPNARLRVLLIDVFVYADYEHKPGMAPPAMREGGTSFLNAFRYLKEQKIKYDALIFVTDGGCADLLIPEADQYRPRGKVLWVLTYDLPQKKEWLRWGPSIVIEQKLRGPGRT